MGAAMPSPNRGPLSRSIEVLKCKPVYPGWPVPKLQALKLNPIWWLKNDDEQKLDDPKAATSAARCIMRSAARSILFVESQ